MGDRGHNRHIRKEEAAVSLSWREGRAGSPSNTMSLGLRPTSFGHNRHGPKIGGSPLLGEGELGSHLTQCRLGSGLPPYQVASWSNQPFGHNRYGPKIGGCALWRSSDPPGHMSILLTNSRVEGGVGLTWEAGSACLEEAGKRQSNRFWIMHVECLSKACDWWMEIWPDLVLGS